MQRRSQDLRKYLRRRDLYKKYCCKGLHLKYLSGSWLHFCMEIMILWLQFLTHGHTAALLFSAYFVLGFEQSYIFEYTLQYH